MSCDRVDALMNWLADGITPGASISSVDSHTRSEIIRLLIDIVVCVLVPIERNRTRRRRRSS